jgi:hypothetical protein
MEFFGIGVALCIAIAAVTLSALVAQDLGLDGTVAVVAVARRRS